LVANRGKDLIFEVYVEAGQRWQRYQSVVNRIADEEIDSHIAYRVTGPVHYNWGRIAVRQRDLTTYEDSPILDGMSFGRGCVNCHSFASNNPNRMSIGTRSVEFGDAALLVRDGNVTKIGTPFGYTAWHPSGELAVYSINKVRQFSHTAGMQVRDVIDLDAALAYYSAATNNVKMVPRASDKDRLETYPAWSPDGRYLYYCGAPFLWTDRDSTLPQRYAEVQYDLMRIRYDIDNDVWGVPETVLSAKDTGLSILLPRVSPDGRFLLFCMCQYGCFPIYQPTSDLYMLDLESGDYTKLAVNSEFSESWHSWSSNSRWIAFSSKRGNGLFTRSYLTYIDETGRASNPLILPQRDPEFYDSLLKTITVPELITGEIPINRETLARAARSQTAVTVDAITAPTRPSESQEYGQPSGHY
jgi:Tol biopolymer transport system component